MVKGTMFSGESKNIESKVSLPDKSEKYVKTIVAFANTQGGKLIVGVDDKNHQVIGVENDILFQTMDAIATAVSDSCMPQIIPDIEPQTVEGKTIIIVSVEAGKNRPYYLKSKGKENGTYIRVAGTSRQAFPEKIKELEMEGARISWDELTCVGYTVTEEATEKLCQDIEVFGKKRECQNILLRSCLLYTSDAADEEDSVDLGGRRIIKKKIFSSIRRQTR